MPLLPALLIVNPAAGPAWSRARGRLEPLQRLLAARGFDAELRTTEAPGHATVLARDAVSRGVAAVFALGGDGTQRETAAGLLGGPIPLGLLPAGTANVLAPSCGLPRTALLAAGCFGVEDDGGKARPCARDLDVGVLEDRDGERPFLMMASRGLDARSLSTLRPALKRRLGKAGVALGGLREWMRAEEHRFDYIADGEPGRASFLAVQNVAGYGGVAAMAPAADPFDGHLDLVAFAGEGRAATLSFAAEVLTRRHHRDPRVLMRPVARVDLPGSGPVPMQLDGDPVDVTLPATVRLHPQKLRLLVPAGVPAGQASAATAPPVRAGAAA
jgi:diacylglycerol kinase (ATP)